MSPLNCYAGMCCYVSGDYKDAGWFMSQSLASAIENGESYFKGRALIWEGRIMGELTDNPTPESVARIEDGLEQLTELDTKPDMSMAQLFLGELYANTGRKEAAFKNLNKAMSMCQDMEIGFWPDKIQEVLDRL